MSIAIRSGAVLLRGGKAATCCLLPTLQWDSVSGSASKIGYYEWSGYESTPPKRYLTRAVTALYLGYACCTGPVEVLVSQYDIGGVASFDAVTGSCTNGVSTRIRNWNCAGTLTRDDTSTGTYNICAGAGDEFGGVSSPVSSTVESGSVSSGPACDASTEGGSGRSETSWESILSDEYTTATLKSGVVAALGSLPGTWSGTAGSYANLTTDEDTYSVRRAKWRFTTSGQGFVASTAYRLVYVERFTPESGSVVDSSEMNLDFTWDGSATHIEGTTVAIPSANGTTTIVPLRWVAP